MRITNDHVVQFFATLLVGIFVVLLFKSAHEEWRSANPAKPAPGDARYAFDLSRAAIVSAFLIFILGYAIFWIRAFHLGWLLGTGLLVCSGISFRHLASAKARQEPRASRMLGGAAALLAALLGVACLGMAYGAKNVPLLH